MCYALTEDEVEGFVHELDESATYDFEGGVVTVKCDKTVAGRPFEGELGEVLTNLHPELGLGDNPIAIYECGNQCFARDVCAVVISDICEWEAQGFNGNLV